MKPSLKEFKDQYRDRLLGFLWRQWSALGVAGHSKATDPWIVDPDALLLFTATLGRHDARLFDEVLDWLKANGAFINVQRMKRIQQLEGFAGLPVLAAFASVLSRGADTLKWKGLAESAEPIRPTESLFYLPDYRPMPILGDPDERFARAGFLRDAPALRGYSQEFRPNEQTTLALQLRALVGVNARSEILQYLLTHKAAHPAEIARETYYFTKTVQDALVSMHRSGVVEIRTLGREKHYWVQSDAWATLLNRASEGKMPQWITWPAVFSALERIWLKLQEPGLYVDDGLLVSTELRQLLLEIRPAVEKAGFPVNMLSRRQYVGEEFIDVFLADISSILG